MLRTDGAAPAAAGSGLADAYQFDGSSSTAKHVEVPDAHLLFSGEYKRDGADLIITDSDHRFIVRDYFRPGNHVDLFSPDGARLAASIVDALTDRTRTEK